MKEKLDSVSVSFSVPMRTLSILSAYAAQVDSNKSEVVTVALQRFLYGNDDAMNAAFAAENAITDAQGKGLIGDTVAGELLAQLAGIKRLVRGRIKEVEV